MKSFFKGKKLIVLIVALFIGVVAVVSINTRGNDGFISNAARYITRPVKYAAGKVAGVFESIYGYIYEYDEVAAQNELLNARVAELQKENREYQELLEENARLRNLLNFSVRHDGMTFEDAAVISHSASNWTSSFTISKGSDNSSVSLGDCVVSENGILLGRVTSVGKTDSIVTAVIDTSFSASVSILDTGDEAVLKGDFSLMHEGLCILDFFEIGAEVTQGDTIITNGRGGVFPPGLTVGVVTEVLDKESAVGRYAKVRPAVKSIEVTNVFIVVDFVVKG